MQNLANVNMLSFLLILTTLTKLSYFKHDNPAVLTLSKVLPLLTVESVSVTRTKRKCCYS